MAQSCIFARFGLKPILNFAPGTSFLAGGSLFVSSRNNRGASEINLARGLSNAGDSIMVDQEVIDSQLKADRFPFPSEGDITLRVRNANYTLGPVMLHVGMNAGAVIPAHLHKGMAEALYVVEGDFTNEGKQYQAGTSLHFKAGKAHGPHSTKNGCKLLVLWTERTSKEAADLSDFTLATQKAA
jgi:quercetin dioxygenase-like cupin family protein